MALPKDEPTSSSDAALAEPPMIRAARVHRRLGSLSCGSCPVATLRSPVRDMGLLNAFQPRD